MFLKLLFLVPALAVAAALASPAPSGGQQKVDHPRLRAALQSLPGGADG